MPKLSFQIGTAFPADDPVARFVTVVAMMSNDWLRLMDQMASSDDDLDGPGARMMAFRQQASLYHEAAIFLADSRAQFSEVSEFIRSLSAEAQEAYNRVAGGNDRSSPHYLGDWLVKQRNLTFHYPEMDPKKAITGREQLMRALRKAAEIRGEVIEGETLGSVRYLFADEVVVQWLPDVNSPEHVERLREAVTALGQFAWHALSQYLARLPPEALTPDTP